MISEIKDNENLHNRMNKNRKSKIENSPRKNHKYDNYIKT